MLILPGLQCSHDEGWVHDCLWNAGAKWGPTCLRDCFNGSWPLGRFEETLPWEKERNFVGNVNLCFFIAGSVVFQIPHRPNAKLTIRFWAFFISNILEIFGGCFGYFWWMNYGYWNIFGQDGFPQWPSDGGGGRKQHSQLLHHVWHRQLGQVRSYNIVSSFWR